MIIVRFDLRTMLPINAYLSPLPPYHSQPEIVEGVAPETYSLEDDMFALYLDGMNIGNDFSIALSLAKERAIKHVRDIVSTHLTGSDVRVKAAFEHLTIDRSDEAAIEKYYSILSERKQVRDSSNSAQESISQAVSPSSAWDIALNFNLYAAPTVEPAPEITRNAFQVRLSLSLQEKSDPVFQVMTSDLLALGYVDLRQAAEKLNFLVQVGKLPHTRVANILTEPIRWGERPVHGV